MAATDLAVLLRNCTHNTVQSATNVRYALKCDSFSIQIAKTPIQVPIPQQPPEIIDIGFYRPSISIGGIVDNVGQNSNNNYTGFENMEYITVSRKNNAGTDINDIRYYVPYKNALEDAVYTWITTADDALELEIGNAEFPVYGKRVEGASASGDETGGGIYIVAIQQARFQVDPAQEDRWQFQMQFVCESRRDVKFT